MGFNIFPLLQDAIALRTVISQLCRHLVPMGQIDMVIGVETSGCLLGPIVATNLSAAFVPFWKQGELTGDTITVDYGKDILEMQVDAIRPGQSVVVIGGLLSTGESAQAAGKIIARSGGKTLHYLFLVELAFMGTSMVDAPHFSIIRIED
ncbi:adenine phosphoribosyltransferase [Ganoderma leucocontextum]|nr:adenine phosphoribosyltransferase [Ganoderma leucocontextum]